MAISVTFVFAHIAIAIILAFAEGVWRIVVITISSWISITLIVIAASVLDISTVISPTIPRSIIVVVGGFASGRSSLMVTVSIVTISVSTSTVSTTVATTTSVLVGIVAVVSVVRFVGTIFACGSGGSVFDFVAIAAIRSRFVVIASASAVSFGFVASIAIRRRISHCDGKKEEEEVEDMNKWEVMKVN